MPDLGIDVLFKGTNMLRLLQGLWVAMKISIVSILISMPLGILVGALMTVKNRYFIILYRRTYQSQQNRKQDSDDTDLHGEQRCLFIHRQIFSYKFPVHVFLSFQEAFQQS